MFQFLLKNAHLGNLSLVLFGREMSLYRLRMFVMLRATHPGFQKADFLGGNAGIGSGAEVLTREIASGAEVLSAGIAAAGLRF